ncbi:MAG: hypothetical protein E7047_03955 [Lentisphaerae bacterium]|nr:hypothetical protein [Lentisphaerota bacterium]
MFKITSDQQDVPCTIVDAYVAECKFPAKQGETNGRGEFVACYYDVVLQLQDAIGNTDVWHGEISNRTGTGTKAHLYRIDMTLQTLRDIDFNVQNLAELEQQFVATADRMISIPNLINKTCTAVVVKSVRESDGREFCNVRYLNKGGSSAKRLSYDEFIARRSAPAPAAAPGYPAAGYPAAPAPGYPSPAAPATGRVQNPYEKR